MLCIGCHCVANHKSVKNKRFYLRCFVCQYSKTLLLSIKRCNKLTVPANLFISDRNHNLPFLVFNSTQLPSQQN